VAAACLFTAACSIAFPSKPRGAFDAGASLCACGFDLSAAAGRDRRFLAERDGRLLRDAVVPSLARACRDVGVFGQRGMRRGRRCWPTVHLYRSGILCCLFPSVCIVLSPSSCMLCILRFMHSFSSLLHTLFLKVVPARILDYCSSAFTCVRSVLPGFPTTFPIHLSFSNSPYLLQLLF